MKKSKIFAPLVFFSLALTMAGCTAPDAPSNNNAGQTDVLNSSQSQDSGAPKKGGISMEPQTPPAMTDEQTQQLQAGETAHAPATLTFTVDAGNFYFVPNLIKVKKGDTVIINFKNDGGFHNWQQDDFKVTMDPIKTGETKTLQFVADKTGTFEYYCSVGKHRQMGMTGTLIVE